MSSKTPRKHVISTLPACVKCILNWSPCVPKLNALPLVLDQVDPNVILTSSKADDNFKDTLDDYGTFHPSFASKCIYLQTTLKRKYHPASFKLDHSKNL